ncbi:MAG: hypothetical protein M1827_003292 [Pycnora praestabilis]|nr:MAG: hypothetical protein M1827_003292 [Pycnora praestabilis]
MAPSSGTLLIPLAIRLARQAFKKTSNLIRTKLAESTRPVTAELHPILARNPPRHPIHPAAYLRQSKGRWYTTHSSINATIRRFTSSARTGAKYERSTFPKSTVGRAVNSLPHRAPFASTLRPNLTGGALPRTAGGYTVGGGRAGGARYFSHTPAAPAQVVNNVSAAVRAFWLSGQKAQFDGVDPRSGEKRYKAVSALRQEAGKKMRSIPRATPGSFIEFGVNPTITALSPLSGFAALSASVAEKDTLNTEGLMDLLSIDFSRALKDLAAILNDLKRLSALGDLPLTLSERSTIRVHFPGCDARTVERLCDEVGVQRGVIRQDEGFDAFVGTEIALLFPFAPSRTPSETSQHERKQRLITKRQKKDEIEWRNMLSPEHTTTISPRYSTRSDTGVDFEDADVVEENPWISSPSGYDSFHSDDDGSHDDGAECYFERPRMVSTKTASEYEGLEGIYRFLEQCDTARR